MLKQERFFYEKNNVPPHTKVCGLNGTYFLDARKNHKSFFCTENSFNEFSCDPKLKLVSYDPIIYNGVFNLWT